jgi:hypothetical protein
VCADDNHNDDANNEGIAAGVEVDVLMTMRGKMKGVDYWIEIAVKLKGIKENI